MPNFNYVAVNGRGDEVKGSIEAESIERASSELKKKGFTPIDVTEANFLNQDLNLNFSRKPSTRDLSIFCRQFASMVRAGVPIMDTIRMLADQTENKRLKEASNQVRADLEKGESLSSAMAMHPKVYPEIMINMVTAGEASGNLEMAMERVAEQFEKSSYIAGLVKKAMVYPIMVLVIAVVVVVVMLVVVIPSYMVMFEDLGTDLPKITQMVIKASDFIQAYWYILIAVGAAIFFGLRTFLATESGKYISANLQFRFPALKDFLIKLETARMARTLSSLIAAGVPLVESVDIVAKSMSNVLIRDIMIDAKEQILVGVPLSTPLEESDLFPPMVHNMLRIGEESGTSEEMMRKLADYYDEEVEAAIGALLAAMEPMIIVVLAAIVGVLVAAVMAPMLTMYEALETL